MMAHKIDLIQWDDRAKGTFPLIEELHHLRAVNAGLLAACEAIYSEVGKGGDLDWHLHDKGYSRLLHEAIMKAKGEED
jgi:hypothetical protein